MKRREFLKAGLGVAIGAMYGPSLEALASLNAQSSGKPRNVPYFGRFREVAPLSIRPSGWLLQMLERQVNGLAKHHAVSGFPYNTCLWAGKIPVQDDTDIWPYEQTGYLVDGLERLGLCTGDHDVAAEAKKNIDFVAGHPNPDGSLGLYVRGNNWPHTVIFRALQAEFMARHDPKIMSAMHRHFLATPAGFGHGERNVTNIEAMLRVFDATGDARMLELAKATFSIWNDDKAPTCLEKLASAAKMREHGVTFNETAKLPALLYLYTGDKEMLEASINGYRKLDRDHMLASGLHSCQEYLEGNDPSLYHETCDITDYTWSLGYLLMATGDAIWADHIEKCVFNAGLGAITKDFKAHQYFSSPNQVECVHGMDIYYDPNRAAYRPGFIVECCSGNVHRFLPNYALRQWMTTPDGGIVAALYGASSFATKVGGTPVTIEQKTDYPFSEYIEFTVKCGKPVRFALLLRIPDWAEEASIRVNGKVHFVSLAPGTFQAIDREFANGDRIELHLPMMPRLRYWGNNAASVERGPLVYSLKIEEDSKEVFGDKTAPGFPAYDKRPASAWNYGLRMRSHGVPDQMAVVTGRRPGCPWDIGNSPVSIHVSGDLIPAWQLPKGKNPTIPENPKPAGNPEPIALVPYGSTHIRLTVFPLL